MNPIFAELPTTVFEVMSRLARETARSISGQGFPDDPGPEDVRAQGGRRRPRRLEPVSADDGLAGAAPGRGRALPASRALDLDWATRGDGHLRRHRGAGGAPAGADRAGRRGGALPAALRRLSAAGPPGRRRAALRQPGAAALALRPRRCWRAAFTPKTHASCCSTTRSTRRARSSAARISRCSPTSA